MNKNAHLWAIVYDNMEQADRVREEVGRLARRHCLFLHASAVVVRYHDGSVTLDGEPFVAAIKLTRHTLAGFLAGLALGAPPLTGAVAGALARGDDAAAEAGIDDDFILEVERMMKPGTSALFVLDEIGDMTTLLQGIRGLGGTVLRTNVDPQHARLIQSTLAESATPSNPGGK
jgi:uncharacterized membrane protein